LLHRFGPLSGPDGRKALATVITRARGRTTVVSSIGVQDLDHARLRSDGARDLRAMLWVLQGGPDIPVVPHVAALTGSEEEIAPPAPQEPRISPAAPVQEGASHSAPPAAPAGEEPAGAEEMSDEDLDKAIEAAMARRSADTPASAEPAGEDAPETDSGEGAGPADGGTTAAEETAELAAEGTEEPAHDGSAADAAGADAAGAADAGDAAGAEGAGAVPSREPRALETDALVQDLADRLHRLGLLVERDFGLSSDRIELALGHPDMPGRMLLAVDTDGAHYVDTPSQRERDRLRAERLEAAGWATERVWSWALFIDPDGEAERIRRAVDRALRLVQAEESSDSPAGVGTIRHRLPRTQIPAGHPL